MCAGPVGTGPGIGAGEGEGGTGSGCGGAGDGIGSGAGDGGSGIGTGTLAREDMSAQYPRVHRRNPGLAGRSPARAPVGRRRD